MPVEAVVGVHLEVEVEGGSWYPATVVEVGDQRVIPLSFSFVSNAVMI
eukprot:COSAG02_NODE_11257_length_1758_cov_56.182640_4_plen_48_part_00